MHDFELELVILGAAVKRTTVCVGNLFGPHEDHFQQAFVVLFRRQCNADGIQLTEQLGQVGFRKVHNLNPDIFNCLN